MTPATSGVAQVRRAACRRNGCTHDLALCDDLDAHCPAGVWGDPEPLPGMPRRILNFGKAVVRHVAAGLPHREPAEIERITAICRGCEHFRITENACAKCGCGIANKIPWARERCPVGKWP